MKFKLTANADIDLLTDSEVRKALKDAGVEWRAELARGVKFVRRSASGTISESGALSINDSDMGPADGFTWSVTLVSVTGLLAAEQLAIYQNEASDTRFIGYAGAGPDGMMPFDKGVLPFHGTEYLVAAGTGYATTGRTITVVMRAIEVPVQTEWQLA